MPGADLTTERTPLEAGLAHLVKAEGRSFVGREALVRRSGADAWTMALLDIETEGDLACSFFAHTVFDGAKPVGVVTSAAPGFRTGRTLALAYLRPGEDGQRFDVCVLGREAPGADPAEAALRSRKSAPA